MEGNYIATGLDKGLATMVNKRVGPSGPAKAKYAMTGHKKLAMDAGYAPPARNSSAKKACSY
jgi:hypothetical protein